MNRFLRGAAIALVALAPFIQSCKKGETVDPQPTQTIAAEVAGTYQLTFAQVGTSTLPLDKYSGTITATKVGDDAVNLTLTIKGKETGETTEADMGDVSLVRQGGKVLLSVDGDNAGTYQNNTIEVLARNSSGAITLRGKK